MSQPIDRVNNTYQVRAVQIDMLDSPHIDFIKIDVEGMEHHVLRGGIKSIAVHKPILSIEVLKDDLTEVRALLEPMDYVFKYFPPNVICIPTNRLNKQPEEVISCMDTYNFPPL